MSSVRPLKRKSSTRRSIVRHAPPHAHAVQKGHTHAHHYWMIVTLAAFPLVMALSSFVGFGPAISFLAGAVGSLLVLLLNIMLEHEFWMLNSHWKFRFEDPDFSHRLLVVSGALLLMVETSFMIFFLIDQPFAAHLVRLLFVAQT
jgi:hypothetical protein